MFDLAGWLTAWNDADLERVLSYYAPECRYRDPAVSQGLAGREALREHLVKVFAYWPEQEWREVRRFEHRDGQGLTLHWRAAITSARSGRSVEFEGLDVLRFREGKIGEQYIAFDPAAWRSLIPARAE